jgi:hypothetical protein
MSKLDDLEQQKLSIEQQIMVHRSKTQKTVVTEDTLRQLLASFKDHVADRTSYVEKVIVYKEHVELSSY